MSVSRQRRHSPLPALSAAEENLRNRCHGGGWNGGVGGRLESVGIRGGFASDEERERGATGPTEPYQMDTPIKHARQVGDRMGNWILERFRDGKLARTEIYRVTCHSPFGCPGALINYVNHHILYFRC